MLFNNLTLKEKILNAPLNPGCYIYKDKNNKVIYIGKAKVLKDRVKQYFNPNIFQLKKIENMIKLIEDVEYVITDSESEALILESDLIKKYKPKYNTLRKDDKNYMWLRINFKEDFPKIELVRERKEDNYKYYGPYYNSNPIKKTIRLLRKIYPYRTCNRKIYEKNGKIISSDYKPCLFYFLNLCKAPCAGLINSKEYKNDIKGIDNYLSTKIEKVINNIKKEMKECSINKDFEKAALLRDRINDLIYINQRIDNTNSEEEFVRIKRIKNYNALKELLSIIDIKDLKIKSNFKIECYDISNISGTNAVGSMIVFIDGIANKRLYRKFRIKGDNTPDDFRMMKEVLERRFNNINNSKDNSFKVKPDLIIIDGGKGQLSSAYNIINKKGIKVNIIGLAKKNEDIFKITNDKNIIFEKQILPINSEARYLIQRIRDEAHRFGINYHRKLREKAQIFSVLNEIEGVGKTIGLKLLKSLGDIDNIRKASKEELLLIVKNKKTVDNIKKILSI